MKKLILAVALLVGSVAYQSASAQVRFSINIGNQPVWGPTGYDHVEYYYFPDIDAYYNVPNRVYYYQDRWGQWRSSRSLPGQYRDFDLYKGYKVVINDDPRPYRHDANYRTKYAQYKGRHDQEVIRNSNDQKYWENKDHPNHNRWMQEHNKNRRNDHNDHRDNRDNRDNNNNRHN